MPRRSTQLKITAIARHTDLDVSTYIAALYDPSSTYRIAIISDPMGGCQYKCTMALPPPPPSSSPPPPSAPLHSISSETTQASDSDPTFTANSQTLQCLVSIPPKFRNVVWMKRGSLVCIELTSHDLLHTTTTTITDPDPTPTPTTTFTATTSEKLKVMGDIACLISDEDRKVLEAEKGWVFERKYGVREENGYLDDDMMPTSESDGDVDGEYVVE